MPQGKVELGDRLEATVFRLIDKLNDLRSQIASLEARCQELEADLAEKTSEAEMAKQSLEAYKAAAVISGRRDVIGDDAAQQAKQRIGLIVREIDKCIALLKQ